MPPTSTGVRPRSRRPLAMAPTLSMWDANLPASGFVGLNSRQPASEAAQAPHARPTSAMLADRFRVPEVADDALLRPQRLQPRLASLRGDAPPRGHRQSRGARAATPAAQQARDRRHPGYPVSLLSAK